MTSSWCKGISELGDGRNIYRHISEIMIMIFWQQQCWSVFHSMISELICPWYIAALIIPNKVSMSNYCQVLLGNQGNDRKEYMKMMYIKWYIEYIFRSTKLSTSLGNMWWIIGNFWKLHKSRYLIQRIHGLYSLKMGGSVWQDDSYSAFMKCNLLTLKVSRDFSRYHLLIWMMLSGPIKLYRVTGSLWNLGGNKCNIAVTESLQKKLWQLSIPVYKQGRNVNGWLKNANSMHIMILFELALPILSMGRNYSNADWWWQWQQFHMVVRILSK